MPTFIFQPSSYASTMNKLTSLLEAVRHVATQKGRRNIIQEMIITIISIGLIYTLLVFSKGFVCSMIRVPILKPCPSDRYMQILKMPLVMTAIRQSAKDRV